MELNIFRPKQAVESAFKNPTVGSAAFIVVLAWIVPILALAAQGLGISIGNEIIRLVQSFVWFALGAAIIYIAAFAIKGNKVSGKFTAILSAWSLVWVVLIIGTLLMAILLPLSVSPSLFEPVKKFSNREIGFETLSQDVAGVSGDFFSLVNIVPLAILFIAGIILFAFAFAIVYHIFRVLLGFRLVPVLAVEIVSFFVFFVVASMVHI